MRIELWADGASSPDGCGGWAYVLVAYDGDVEVRRIQGFGGERDTTNNRMELTAVLRGLQALIRPTTLTVFSDSAYVVNAFRANWIATWQRNNWTRKVKGQGRQPVANQDLWRALIAEAGRHQIVWRHVRGHNGIELNETCDRLAVAAKRALRA